MRPGAVYDQGRLPVDSNFNHTVALVGLFCGVPVQFHGDVFNLGRKSIDGRAHAAKYVPAQGFIDLGMPSHNFSFHGYPDPIICPNDISRKSIALYYYSNGRPDKDKIKEMPNITNWKNRENKKEVYNKYKLKDHLRKISFFRKINDFLK